MSGLIFVPDSREFVDDQSLVARIPRGVHSSERIFEILNDLLKLPGYFGLNWNALFDCLRDFHWVSEHTIIIVHEDFSMLAARGDAELPRSLA